MSGRHVATQTSIYTDPDLSHWRTRTLFFYRYLYDNDHVHGVAGIGRIAETVMYPETRMTHKQIEAAKEEIGDRVMWFSDGTYWVKARAKHTCWTNQQKLHPKFAASVRNCLADQPLAVIKAFAERYPEMGESVLANHRRCIANPTLPSSTVSVAVTVTSTKVQNPPLMSPQKPGSAIPMPKRVGGFLYRSGNEQQRDDFNAFLQETLAVSDFQTVQKALKELNLALRDHEPTNLPAYARPIFDRNVKQWQRNRRDEQELKRLAAETQARSDELDRRMADTLKKRLAGKAEGHEDAKPQEATP